MSEKKADKKSPKDVAIDILGDQIKEAYFDETTEDAFIPTSEGLLNIMGSAFVAHIQGRLYDHSKMFLSKHQREDLKSNLYELIRHKGRRKKIYKRVKNICIEDDIEVIVNLGKNRCVKITKSGWNKYTPSELSLYDTSNMLKMPDPVAGDIWKLRSYLNLKSDNDFYLILAFMINSYITDTPYNLLCIIGEQGSAKSTTTKMIVKILDNLKTPIRSMPRKEEDLALFAKHCHLIAFDNLSGISYQMSDAICKLTTGGAIGKRALYTTADEFNFFLHNPIIVNGIDDLLERPDLSERAILITCPRIEDNDRRSEFEIWKNFEKDYPEILGGFYDLISKTLKYLPHINPEKMSRMADFNRIGIAMEKALKLPEGHFMSCYQENSFDKVIDYILLNPLALRLAWFGLYNKGWTGTPTELFKSLRLDEKFDKIIHDKRLPKNADVLGRAITRIAPNLRKFGVIYTKYKNNKSERQYSIDLDFSDVPLIIDPFKILHQRYLSDDLRCLNTACNETKFFDQISRVNFKEIYQELKDNPYKYDRLDLDYE